MAAGSDCCCQWLFGECVNGANCSGCDSKQRKHPGVPAAGNATNLLPCDCRGGCVDVFAPGVSILSAVATNDQSTALKTGTSMAAPFVTGVVATYLEKHPVSSSAQLTPVLARHCTRYMIAHVMMYGYCLWLLQLLYQDVAAALTDSRFSTLLTDSCCLRVPRLRRCSSCCTRAPCMAAWLMTLRVLPPCGPS
jgi:hypothetical protein